MGEMLLLKPGTEGAIGLARCRNSSVSMAILRAREDRGRQGEGIDRGWRWLTKVRFG